MSRTLANAVQLVLLGKPEGLKPLCKQTAFYMPHVCCLVINFTGCDLKLVDAGVIWSHLQSTLGMSDMPLTRVCTSSSPTPAKSRPIGSLPFCPAACSTSRRTKLSEDAPDGHSCLQKK